LPWRHTKLAAIVILLSAVLVYFAFHPRHGMAGLRAAVVVPLSLILVHLGLALTGTEVFGIRNNEKLAAYAALTLFGAMAGLGIHLLALVDTKRG
jgi:hypothetical protein